MKGQLIVLTFLIFTFRSLFSQDLPAFPIQTSCLSVTCSGINPDSSSSQKSYIYGWPWEWQVPGNTGSYSFIFIEDTANPRINQNILSDGDFIGAFYTGSDGTLRCAGAGEWLNQSLVFPIVGDDSFTPVKEGFASNEVIKFGFFDYSKNKTYFLRAGNFTYGECANCNTTGRYSSTQIYRLVDMFYQYNFDVVANAEPDSLCESGITQLNAVIDGTGGPFTYQWTSIPSGLYSNLEDPQFFINQTTDFIVKVIDEQDTSSHHALVRVTPRPVVFAGTDQSICAGGNVNLAATLSNYKNFIWNKSGDGTFSSTTIANPVYYPGSGDINNGMVHLWVSATSNLPCLGTVTDTLTVFITKSPSVNAGPDGVICAGDIISLNATAANYLTVTWSREGSGTAGTFNDPNILNPVYTPSNFDISLGYVLFSVLVTPVNPCVATASDQITVNITKAPVASAGANGSICGSAYFTTAGTAYYYHHVQWTSTGDGYFQNPGTLNTRYYPGVIDKAGRNITLTLTAYPNAPCMVPATSGLNLFIRKAPEVSGPPDGTACEGNAHILTATAASYTSVTWTSTGSGIFTNPTALTTQYIPDINDALTGNVTIYVSAFGVYPCNYAVTDSTLLQILQAPTASAGQDQFYCDREPVNLSGSASNYQNIQWVSTGDGVFSDATSLNTVYTPGVNDTIAGTCKIILTSAGNAPCIIPITDTLVLTRVPQPQVDAGNNSGVICLGQVYQCSGSVSNAAGFVWMTSGDGIFSNPTILNPVYTPGVQDKINRNVILSLEASYYSPCNQSISDEIALQIIYNPVVDAGMDVTICESDQVQLNASASDFASVMWSWTGSGNPGTFSNQAILDPVYTPGNDDIAAGFAPLMITASPLNPCTAPASDQITVYITRLPQCGAGEDGLICSSSVFPVTGTATDYDYVLWSSTGDGYFQDNSILNTVYFPGIQDQLGGTILLSLAAFPNAPCLSPVISELSVTITRAPEIIAPQDAVACVNNPLHLIAAAVSYSSVLWTSTGTGSFSNPDSLITTYTPSIQDELTGLVTLEVTVTGNDPCSYSVSDYTLLTFSPSPTSMAGSDQPFCDLDPVNLTGNATNYESVLWTSTGDGYFSQPDNLNSLYYPGNQDTLTGSCRLILVVTGISPCVISVTDTMVLTRVPEPQVIIDDASAKICFNQSYQCGGVVENAAGFRWQTTGDGYFSDPDILNPEYFPGIADQSTGSVMLRLVAYFMEPCIDSVSDQMVLAILQNPEVDAGFDLIVCSTGPVQLDGNINLNGNLIDQLIWTTSGTGTFSNPNFTDSQYVPSQSDSIAGSVTLELSVQVSPCSGIFSDHIILHFPDRLTVTEDISSVSAIEGDEVTFHFDIVESGNTYYYWFGPEGLIPGADQSVLTISQVGEEDEGVYFCLAENECSVVQSTAATLDVVLKLSMMLPSGWSGISTNINPIDLQVDSLLFSLNGNLEVIKNLGSFNWPGQNIQQFQSWDTTSGYLILLQNSQTLTILGDRFSTMQVLVNPGWNIIPVLNRCATATEAVFGNVPGIWLVKEVAGEGIYWPSGSIYTLPLIEPGKAYFVYANTLSVIDYPACDGESGIFDYSLKNSESVGVWEKPEPTTNTQIVGIHHSILKKYRVGDIIGVFNQDNLCLGWVRICDTGINHALIIFGNEDGTSENQHLTYKIFENRSMTQSVIQPGFDPALSSPLKFSGHGISMITSFSANDDGRLIFSDPIEFTLVPNPASDELSITLKNSRLDRVIKIMILDEHGRIVKTEERVTSEVMNLDIKALKQGIYTVLVIAGDFSGREKLIKLN